MPDDRHDGPEPDPPDPDFAAWVASFGPPIAPEDFRPFAYLNREGDQLEVHLSLANYYGKWLGGGIVVLLEQETDRVVGVIVEGIGDLMGGSGLRVADRKIGEG